MHRAIVILKRALNDILDNPVVALQVSVLPLLITTFVGQHFLEQAILAQRGSLFLRGQFVWWLWVLGFVGVFLPILWMAVGWHRFVLLGEKPWPIAPRLHVGRILSYGWATIVVAMIAVVLVLVARIAVGVVVGLGQLLIEFDIPPLLGTLGRLFEILLVTFALMFQSAFLVSAACGRRMSIGDAMEYGDLNTETIFFLTLASLALAWGLEQITGLTHAQGLILGGYELVSNWFIALFNVGILTALAAETWFDPPLPPEPPAPIMPV